MMARFQRIGRHGLGGCSLFVVALIAGQAPAAAQSLPELAAQMEALKAELAEQRASAARQQNVVIEQQRQIKQLQQRLDMDAMLAGTRGRGLDGQEASAAARGAAPGDDADIPAPPANPSALPERPVGEAPAEPDARERVQVLAVPEGQGVLTPAGMLVIDPQIEYVNSANNRLVFRGIELIPGIQIGLIEASTAERDTLVGTMAFRYGISRRLEAEVRVPFLSRNDRIEVVQQRDIGIVREIRLAEDNLGDIEFNLRYQLNRMRPLKPIWVAQLRVKSDTGKSPYEVGFDEFGVATGLATGSGFWGVQPGISFLLPSDPVVIFGGGSYLWNIARNVDQVIGEASIGRVNPGDAISANLGFGFALNPRFSYSLGYRHSYITPTTSEIGTTIQRSNRLQVGSFSLGMSYRLSQSQTLNVSFTIGVTEDAPDIGVSIRLPFSIGGRR